ncbi:hypothetical protein BGZ63DRAFT_360102 [Mariannaea sp. PMI_226]|nr:hypothetical protein BGZ63DRAFT_360102 [Mariannaea sp. PMI_226]
MVDTEPVDIYTWLCSIPDRDAYGSNTKPFPPIQGSSKRKAPQQEPSPPVSLDDPSEMNEKTPKRRRIDDPNRTPRPADSLSSASSSFAPSESDTPSRSSSPKKQMMSLRLDEGGLECRQLNIDTAPSCVADLLASIREIGNGLEVLPHSFRSTIRESTVIRDKASRVWKYAFKEPDQLDTLPGRIPQPEEVALICEHARQCHDKSHEEASWNMEVHHRLLQAVFRYPASHIADPFNFTTCTTARPHGKFLPYSSTAKMVDFCLYFDDNDKDASLQALSRRTPTLSVNHTDFAPLQLSPIALSIETKRPGKELNTAQLQMGVWHAAQWKFLQSVIGLTSQVSSATEVARRQLAEDALTELGFIPAIIVHGHRWLFVFSTREDKKTVLWTERQIGTTQSILDTYQIVAGLREVAGWARDVYMPWFRSKVLSGFGAPNG